MKSLMNSGKIYSRNTKVIGFLFLALTIQLSIAIVGFSQSTYAQVDEAFKTYENPKFGISLTYPPNWSVDELRNDPVKASNNSVVAIIKSPSQGQNDKYLENVIINIQGPRSNIASLETYTQNSLKAFNNMSDTIKITKSSKDTLSGLPAHQLQYTSTGIPGLTLQKMQVFTVVNNNTAYVVTYGAEIPEYSKNLQNVEKMINSIKIDEKAMENVKENQNQPTKTGSNGPTVLIDQYYG
jgi:eukaryotic-like serine/threonine-protein kinase